MSNKTETKQEHQKKEMLKKASKMGLKFGINHGKEDGGLEILSCEKRFLQKNAKGELHFIQENTPKLIWSVFMTCLGTLVPAAMFLEDNWKLRAAAVFIFTIFQIGAIVIVNAGRPNIQIFDKNRGRYSIRRANHLLTRSFRKTVVPLCELNKVGTIKIDSFKAKRWDMRWIGTGDNKYRHQELRTYENYRLSLKLYSGEEINLYDWHELEHMLEIGEEIAEYLGLELKLT